MSAADRRRNDAVARVEPARAASPSSGAQARGRTCDVDAGSGTSSSVDGAAAAHVTQPVLSVFFDGACPLCRREIAFFRRRPGADRIAWVDVSESDDAALAPGLCKRDALRRFHVRLPDGRLASGADGFAHLWRAMPGFQWLGRLAQVRGIDLLAEWAYRGFLHLRPSLQRLARLGWTGGCRRSSSN